MKGKDAIFSFNGEVIEGFMAPDPNQSVEAFPDMYEPISHLLCPECNKPVQWSDTCHTFPGQGETWMACMGCFSAIYWDCSTDDCHWGYVEGLNSRNPRAAENETKKPDWLVEDSIPYKRYC